MYVVCSDENCQDIPTGFENAKWRCVSGVPVGIELMTRR